MARVLTAELKPGAVLECDVQDAKGRLLLPAGTELTEGRIELLARQKVAAVEVETQCSERDLAAASRFVRHFFTYVNHDDVVMGRLFQLAVRDTARAMAEGFRPREVDERLTANNEHLADLFIKGEGGPEEMVAHEEEIASFPDVYFRLREVLAKRVASAKDVAKVVGADTGLSAKLLKLVNSPLYGFSASIDTVERAVALVGEKELTTLAMGISAVSYFKDIPPELIHMRIFWKHSLTCAVLSALLAGKAGNLPTEQCFTAGLLHDVGRLIMFKKLPYASVMALQYAHDHFYPLVEAEREVFGYDHGKVAEILLKAWALPAGLTDAVSKHHDPMAAEEPRRAALIQLADNMANALEISEGGHFVLPGMSPGAFELLGLDPKELEGIGVQARRQVNDMASAFL